MTPRTPVTVGLDNRLRAGADRAATVTHVSRRNVTHPPAKPQVATHVTRKPDPLKTRTVTRVLVDPPRVRVTRARKTTDPGTRHTRHGSHR